METRKWITLMAVVFVLGAFSSADACRCILNHLQRSYCDSNAVLKAKFLEATTRTLPGSQDVQKGYKVKVGKVLKGKLALESLTFISSPSHSCGYIHPSTGFNKDYLITAASNNNGDVSVNSCSYIVPWNKLLPKQRKGVEAAYNKGCTCGIEYCSSKPCSASEKTCSIEQYEGGDAENQLRNQICVPITRTTCEWRTIE
ncbi:metalloproteinase inhibitor 1-like isoform X1 [Pleurodeles waltl]|uniref:metalloproteinase inhibitor 1-like isoform X1 n=1 Tax=Pleurodeles waltl TaxID=8319 RepID=UPI0037094168